MLGGALQDADDRVWKEALDGLVTLGGVEAERVLRDTRASLTGEKERAKREWKRFGAPKATPTGRSGQDSAVALPKVVVRSRTTGIPLTDPDARNVAHIWPRAGGLAVAST